MTIAPEGTDQWAVYDWMVKHWNSKRPIYQSIMNIAPDTYAIPKSGVRIPFPFGPRLSGEEIQQGIKYHDSRFY